MFTQVRHLQQKFRSGKRSAVYKGVVEMTVVGEKYRVQSLHVLTSGVQLKSGIYIL